MRLSKLHEKVQELQDKAEDHLEEYDASYEEIVFDRDNSEEFEAGYITACKQIIRKMEETYPALKE